MGGGRRGDEISGGGGSEEKRVSRFYISRGWHLCGLIPLRVLKPKMTAARVASVRFMTILSKSAWEETVRKLCFRLLQLAVPVIKLVVIELVPLRGGNEFGTRP